MSNNQYYDREVGASHLYQDAALERTLMQRVFVWMTIGLGITGLASYLTLNNPSIFYAIATNKMLFWGLIIAELGLVMGLSGLINRISSAVATALFGVYAALNGVTMAFILALYTMESVATTFFVTAGTFGAMALYGYTTKRDLSSWGSMLRMALIGLIIAGVVNIFWGNSTMNLIISAVGVLIFVGLTAYDVNKIKALFAGAIEDNEEIKKISVLGALTLYLDFVNLFLYLLRFLGRRR